MTDPPLLYSRIKVGIKVCRDAHLRGTCEAEAYRKPINGVMFLQLSHCAISIYFRIVHESEKLYITRGQYVRILIENVQISPIIINRM